MLLGDVMKKYTNDTIIEKFRLVHGDLYDYGAVSYTGSRMKVTIGCPVHGPFTQEPANHLKGVGCPSCYVRTGRTKMDHKEYISACTSKHDGKYDYSNTNYTGSLLDISVVCRVHGTFNINASRHLSGGGCVKCVNQRNTNTQEYFVAKSKEVHGDKYDYINANYTHAKNKVELSCDIHGTFFQTAGAHMAGHGCKECAKSGFKDTLPGSLYILEEPNLGMVKVGITHNLKIRLRDLNRESGRGFLVHKEYKFISGLDARKHETIVLEKLSSLYETPKCKYPGYTETFLGTSATEVRKIVEKSLDPSSLVWNTHYIETQLN